MNTEIEAKNETKEPNQTSDHWYEKVSKIPVDLSVEVGKARLKLKDLMGLKEGDVVALNCLISDPFDVFANGEKIGEGKIVESENKFYLKVSKLTGEEVNE